MASEGNAQTLRLIARVEKRQHDTGDLSGVDETGRDGRCGLNLSARTLAAILKYDHRIPRSAKKRGKLVRVTKGYYQTEADVVEWVKRQVAPRFRGHFKTVECRIMDLADDIAYSTYDLEDTFKAGFLNPLDLLASADLFVSVAAKVSDATGAPFTPEDVRDTLLDLFRDLAAGVPGIIDTGDPEAQLAIATFIYTIARNLGRNGYIRSDFTSGLIRQAIDGVTFS